MIKSFYESLISKCFSKGDVLPKVLRWRGLSQGWGTLPRVLGWGPFPGVRTLPQGGDPSPGWGTLPRGLRFDPSKHRKDRSSMNSVMKKNRNMKLKEETYILILKFYMMFLIIFNIFPFYVVIIYTY